MRRSVLVCGFVVLACSRQKAQPEPVRTEISEPPAQSEPSAAAPSASEPAPSGDVASDAGDRVEELAQALIDAGAEFGSLVDPSSDAGGTVGNLARELKRLRGPFRACYTQALAQDPNASGKVTVKMTIGAGGAVTKLEVAKSGNLPSATSDCIRKAVQTAKFDPPDGGSANVTFPLIFSKAQ